MKIALTTGKGGMDDKICQDFDKCPTITIVNSSSMQATIISNAKAKLKTDGRNIAKEIIDRKADVVITGVCTPVAMKMFFKSGIKVYSGFGKVRDVVTALLKGRLSAQKIPKRSFSPESIEPPSPASFIGRPR